MSARPAERPGASAEPDAGPAGAGTADRHVAFSDTARSDTADGGTADESLPTPDVISPVCRLKVSSELLPLLAKVPRSDCLAFSTICGRSRANWCSAPLAA